MEAPDELAALHVIGRGIAARVIIRAAISDDNNISRDFGCAGGIGAPLVIFNRVHFPDDGAGLCVKRIEHPVKRRDEDFAPRHGDAAIGHIAAGGAVDLHVDLRLKAPDFPASCGVKRISAARDATGVHHAVDNDGGRFKHAVGAQVCRPGQAKSGNVGGGDVGQLGMVGFARISASRGPIVGADFHFGRRRCAGGEEQCRPYESRGSYVD